MFAACLLAVLGFAVLALSQDRHLARVHKTNRPLLRASLAQRAMGLAMLTSSLPACIAAQGAGFGSLLWVVLMTAAALAVAFTLTWRPQWLRPLAALIDPVGASRP